MPRNEQLLPLRNFKGVNRRDGAERADVLEFLTTQNLWQLEKGVWSMIYGASYDLAPGQIPGARNITSIHRHPASPCKDAVLYYCDPDTAALTSPGSGGLTISEITAANGTIFDSIGAAVSKKLWFCFSYVGMGVESAWDARARPGFTPYAGVQINAWDVGGLQSYTMATTTNKLNVSHPTAFPADVRSVNVFMAMGNASDASGDRRNFAFVGSLISNTDVLAINTSIGPKAAGVDPLNTTNIQLEARSDSQGKIPAGQYYVSVAWITEGNPYEEFIESIDGYKQLLAAQPVQVSGKNNAIAVNYWNTGGTSNNGATHCYVFLGTKAETEGPMNFVGALRISASALTAGTFSSLMIRDIPYNSNAASFPCSSNRGFFYAGPHMRAAVLKNRWGFIIKKDADRPVAISEVFVSRSSYRGTQGDDPFPSDLVKINSNFDLDIDGASIAADPRIEAPSSIYFSGLSYFANGLNFIVSDAISVTRMVAKSGCIIPKGLNRLGVIKSQLVGTSSEQNGVTLGSNANAANNWSDGGTGTALKFVILGDGFSQAPCGFGVHSFTDGIEGPKTLLATFKKNSIWTVTGVPDSTSGVNVSADQLSGRVGCVAWKTIVQTKAGMIFLGSDGVVYVLGGGNVPFPIGGRVYPILKHLTQNDTLMKMCSAVYHDNHWKLAYPSSPTSTFCDAEIWADLRTEDGSPIIWVGPHIGRNIGCQLVLSADDDDERRIGALAGAVGSMRLDDPSADQNLSTDITTQLEWTLRRVGAEFNNKRWKGVFLEAFYDSSFTHDLLVEGFADDIYTQKTESLCVADVNGEARWRDHEIYFPSDNLVGKRFKFRLTHTGKPLSISAVAIPWKPERRVGA